MTTIEKQEFRVSRSVAVSEVERLLGEVDSHGSDCEWHLNLSEVQLVQPLASGRLAAALRSMARERLIVTLPADEKSCRYRALYRTGLLAAIAAHADEIRGEPDSFLERVRKEPLAYSGATNFVAFNGVDDGSLILRKNRFANRLWKAMAKFLPDVELGLPKETKEALVEIGYEGIANVADHAFTRPFEGSERRTAFCVLSWQREMTATGDDRLGLASYLDRVKEAKRSQGLGWLMLRIVDDGNGIPARHSLDADIYTESIASEESALVDSLEDEATVKLRAGDAPLRGDPGWGMTLIAEALIEADGYGCLRTGRHSVEVDAFGARQDWTPRPDPLPILRGSVLELVLPVEDPQGELPV